MKCLLACFLMICLLWSGRGAFAIQVPWPDGTYKYTAFDQNIQDIFVQLGNKIGVGMSFGDGVEGATSISNDTRTAQDFFEHLIETHNLQWHYDGSKFNISKKSEDVVKLISVHPPVLPRVVTALKKLDVYDKRFPMYFAKEEGLLMVVGPRSYISLLFAVIEDVTKTVEEYGGTVTVYRGASKTEEDAPLILESIHIKKLEESGI